MIKKNDYILIIGGMNARMALTPIPDIVGEYRKQTVNNYGRKRLECATFKNLKVNNTLFCEKINVPRQQGD